MRELWKAVPDNFVFSSAGHCVLGNVLLPNIIGGGVKPVELRKNSSDDNGACWDEKGTTVFYRADEGLFVKTVDGGEYKVSDKGEPLAIGGGKVYMREGGDVKVCAFDGGGKKTICSVGEDYFFQACAA